MTDAPDPGLFFEHTAVGIALLDPQGLVVRVNAPLRAMLGRSSAELMGQPLTRHVHDEDDVATHAELLGDLERRGLRHVELERRYRSAAGDPVIVREVVCAATAGALVSLEDVTGLRRVEAERRAQMCLAHLGEMASVVAHEVRNALAGIGSAVEVIGQGFSAGTEERLAVEEVRRRVRDLSEMARGLVRIARVRPLRRSAISAKLLLAEVARALAGGEAPTALDVRGPDVDLQADPELLATALVHLITTRAQRGAPACVAVSARPGWVELRIEGERAAAYEAGPAVELDGRLARCIIEAHGGQLSIEQGAAAVVALPRREGTGNEAVLKLE